MFKVKYHTDKWSLFVFLTQICPCEIAVNDCSRMLVNGGIALVYGKTVEPPTSRKRTTHINITHPEISTIQISLSNYAKWEFSLDVVVRTA